MNHSGIFIACLIHICLAAVVSCLLFVLYFVNGPGSWRMKVLKYFDLRILLISNRDSDKMTFERLQKEFDAARASQTEGN